MRILVAGDVHANGVWWVRICEAAIAAECSTILQLGDFGWWPHVQPGATFIELATKSLDHYDLEAAFIDGNHENFDELWTHPAGPEGSVELSPRLHYLPRGHQWTWGGTRFAALGGAHSTDQRLRTSGESWWPQERIRTEDMARLTEHADVLVCHDAPSGVVRWRYREDPMSESAEHRRLVRAVVEQVRPRLVLHAHYHHRYTDELQLPDGTTVEVEGMGRDRDEAGSCLVLETDTLKRTPLPV